MLSRGRSARTSEKPTAFVRKYGPCLLFIFCLGMLQLLHKLDHWRDEAACDLVAGTPVENSVLLAASTVEASGTSLHLATSVGEASPGLLVLGMAANLKIENILIFCLSFRRFHPDKRDRLVLFLNEDQDPDLASVTRLLDVTIVRTREKSDLHPSSSRWIEFEKYLATLAPEAVPTYLFHADVRDTAFQGNLIDAFRTRVQWDGKEPVLIAMMETGIIKNCAWNSGWIKDCFGAKGLNEVQKNVISCSGTTLGSYPAMKQYVSAMANSIKKRRSCERNGVDQGMHNYFINTPEKSLPGVRIIRSSDIVIQVQTTERLQSDIIGRVTMNSDNKVVFAVVHQYDRSGWLHKRFLELYPVVSPNSRRARAKGPRLKQ